MKGSGVRPIGVGIIGTGLHGTRYARHIIADVPGLALAAVSRRSSEGERQAAEWGVRWFADWEDLAADAGVEAVVAAVTPDLNPAVAAACARAGKPLLVEKPMAGSAAAGAGMVDAFARTGLPLTVGQTLRYNATVLGLRRHLSRAGELHIFYANQRLEPPNHAWLEQTDVAMGGVILHTAVHLFDALRFITGREVVRVRAATYRRRTIRLEDAFTAQVEMADGLAGVVESNKLGPGRSGRYEFVGTEGQIQGDQILGDLVFIGPRGREAIPHGPPVSTIVPLLREWEAGLRGRGPNPIPGEDGLAAVRICEACYRSAVEDRWVEVG